ncbi:MAG: ABC transporter permease subunit [Actinomycetia bacterium]|nr:ABC transporter permease subunit [Actinomycetes bacterium]
MLTNVFTKALRDRWLGMTIGAVALALYLLAGMAVYRDIDVSIYTDLPEPILELMGISADTDVGGLAYGAIYGTIGALTLAGLSIAMGSRAIAGEERNGTIGLLLANPISRTGVAVAKGAAIVTITGLGAAILWVAALVVPRLLGVDTDAVHISALVAHLYANALFYGFLALLVGAWTGSSGMASGVSSAVMIVSYIGSGLLRVIEGWEDGARLLPWHYYDSGQPVNNGAQWSNLAILLGAALVFGLGALAGVNRRDLREHSTGVTLLDRLRSQPLTQRIIERLAGSTRVSRIWVKTASEHQGVLTITGLIMVATGALVGPIYNLMDDELKELSDQFPEALLAMVGGVDISTAEGYFQAELFSLTAPIAIIALTVIMGTRALAGEEARHTMGLLLANPVSRRRVVLAKSVALVANAAALAVATFAGTMLGAAMGGLELDAWAVGAACVHLTLLGVVFGFAALTIGAATGEVKAATFGAVGLGLGFYLMNSFLPLNDSVAGYARLSPFYYYLESNPLVNGLHLGHAAVLALVAAVLLTLAVVLFDRRDLT